MSDESSMVGTSLVLTVDGQKVTGRIVEVREDRLLVKVGINQPAKGYMGTIGKAILPNGEVVKFDLGRQSYYSELLIEVPLPDEDAPPAAPDQERRKFFRLAIELPFEVVENVGFSKEYVRTRGTTVNISGGGMLLDFDQPIIPGVYKFRIHLPGEVLVLAGRVIRKPGMASGSIMPVEFIDIHEVERSKLIRLIFNRMRNLKEPGDGHEEGGEEGTKPHHAPKNEDEPRYWRRREKFYKPGKIRYW